MTAVTLPNTAIKAGYLPSEANWGVAMSANLRTLDALVQGRVADKDLTVPPVTPVAGTVYIVGPAATGAWATHSGKLAVWDAGDDITAAWRFVVPKAGWHFFVVDEDAYYRYSGSAWVKGLIDIPPVKQTVLLACSDETTPLAVGTGLTTVNMAHGFTLGSVMVGLTTPQDSGSVFTVDVKRNGVSVFSTLPSVDNDESTSLTAAVPAVLATSALVAGDKITVDITQVGDGTAAGLKVYLVGVATI